METGDDASLPVVVARLGEGGIGKNELRMELRSSEE